MNSYESAASRITAYIADAHISFTERENSIREVLTDFQNRFSVEKPIHQYGSVLGLDSIKQQISFMLSLKYCACLLIDFFFACQRLLKLFQPLFQRF